MASETKAPSKAAFLKDVVRYILDRAFEHVQPQIPGSGKKELEKQETGEGRGRLYLDAFYWPYVHDGRAPINYKGLRRPPMIWFKERQLDPRLRNGRTPNRASQLKHLTNAQFKRALAQNQLIVRRFVRGTEPQPFFDNTPDGGMNGFRDSIQPELNELARKQLLAVVGDDLRISFSTHVKI